MTLRMVLHGEDDARTVAGRLRRDGFAAEVVVDRLAGEDDDEDHPWAVLTDAPGYVAELLVEEHDGWLDEDPSAAHEVARGPSPVVPMELPDAPRRIKGHFSREDPDTTG